MATASLHSLQQGLQALYALEVGENVADFLCTDRGAARTLAGGRALHAGRESVFFAATQDEIWVSLFLDPAVLEALGDGARLDDWCLALEGVSHFVYLVWYASHARAVTLLEMELQAEIDKYVMLRTGTGIAADHLRRMLFVTARWRDGLSPEESGRYHEASRQAERYCAALERRYLRDGRRTGLQRELRDFYRRSRDDKLHHIRSLQ